MHMHGDRRVKKEKSKVPSVPSGDVFVWFSTKKNK